jgi:hypothetical protein
MRGLERTYQYGSPNKKLKAEIGVVRQIYQLLDDEVAERQEVRQLSLPKLKE